MLCNLDAVSCSFVHKRAPFDLVLRNAMAAQEAETIVELADGIACLGGFSVPLSGSDRIVVVAQPVVLHVGHPCHGACVSCGGAVFENRPGLCVAAFFGHQVALRTDRHADLAARGFFQSRLQAHFIGVQGAARIGVVIGERQTRRATANGCYEKVFHDASYRLCARIPRAGS